MRWEDCRIFIDGMLKQNASAINDQSTFVSRLRTPIMTVRHFRTIRKLAAFSRSDKASLH